MAWDLKSDIVKGEGNGRLDLELSKCEMMYSRAQYNEALSLLDKLQFEWPNNSDVITIRGFCLYQLNSDGEAMTNFDKAIQDSPRMWEPYSGRGLVYMKKGDMDEAIANFETAIVNGAGADAMLVTALCFAVKDDRAKMTEYIQKAVRFNSAYCYSMLDDMYNKLMLNPLLTPEERKTIQESMVRVKLEFKKLGASKKK